LRKYTPLATRYYYSHDSLFLLNFEIKLKWRVICHEILLFRDEVYDFHIGGIRMWPHNQEKEFQRLCYAEDKIKPKMNTKEI